MVLQILNSLMNPFHATIAWVYRKKIEAKIYKSKLWLMPTINGSFLLSHLLKRKKFYKKLINMIILVKQNRKRGPFSFL